MPPKRKSDAVELEELKSDASSVKENLNDAPSEPVSKKARTSGASSSSKAKTKEGKEPVRWQDVELEDENEDGTIPVYDDCAEIRRKIGLLQKTPGWKVTQWLRDIGGINNNSYSRFMKEKGRTGGASNGTYYAAYVYFEKVRIAEGKKKTPTRIKHEAELPHGYPLERARGWVFTGR
ncbi:uncharacterized protein EV420DRAFT_1637563 [Desarmillaria tabescens]|uniref:DUF7726 domain-containing protein n=1 Tax=Armillaria tabescens TaxID=1929756 RepID=A0AA39NGX0_ARMTA|nr:uncharacterized protein EV420DRAFT_1637563 [Desarmillaria tabescens]KAK0465427.1 hypothetical protein EV420DRAFT_1637563 [Desarmillaria tabescens]